MKNILGISFIFLLCSSNVIAQDMEVTDAVTEPYTPIDLLANYILGDGIDILDIQYDGDLRAIGYFNNGEEEIGIERGVVMTTGRVIADGGHPGVIGTGNQFAGGTASPNITIDSDMTQLDPINSSNDISRYIISFIPSDDFISFDYIFASEEYPEYSCSSFNDLFGFFISGPGINGEFSNNAINMATIPNTADYVSINNLHPEDSCPAINEEYYIDNNGSGNQPVYDGFTTVFTAQADVIPCEEYTIKLIIADKGDNTFDSAVFLAAKSFNSRILKSKIVTNNNVNYISEGCSEAILNFSLEESTLTDYPVNFTLFGTAEDGVDFQIENEDLIIPAGDSILSLTIIPLEDDITEETEILCFDIQKSDCLRDTICLLIKDNNLANIGLEANISLCPTASGEVELAGEVTNDIPIIQTFTNDMVIEISPVGTAITSDIVVENAPYLYFSEDMYFSVCLDIEHNWTSDLDIFLQAPNGFFIELSTDNGTNGDDYTNTCFTTNATDAINTGSAPFSQDWLPEGYWDDLKGSEVNGNWRLFVNDDANGFTGTLLNWNITFTPNYEIDYSWSPSTGLSCTDCPNPIASPVDTTTYSLLISDSFGCTAIHEITVNPVIVDITAAENLCEGSNSQLSASPNFVEYLWSSGESTSNIIIDAEGDYYVTVTDFNGCTVSDTISVSQEDQIIFTILGDEEFCFSESTTLSLSESYQDYIWSTGEVTSQIDVFSSGTYTITVTDNNDCNATQSIEINELPQILLEIEGDTDFCTGQAIIISGTSGYPEYLWSTGATTESITITNADNYQVTITDSEGCQASAGINITENSLPTVSILGNTEVCSNEITTFSADATFSEYLWSTGATTSDIQVNAGGIYTLVVTDENNCSSETVQIELTNLSEIIPSANTGEDIELCEEGNVQLSANLPAGTTGFWSSINDIEIEDLTDPNSFAFDLLAGIYQLTWTLATDNCPALSQDNLNINIATAPKAVDDAMMGAFGEELTGNVLDNDNFVGGVTLEIQTAILPVGLTLIEEDGTWTGEWTFVAPSAGETEAEISYQICSTECPDLCSTALLSVLTPLTEGFVPEGFTPNRDGVNDEFIIPELEDPMAFPDNKIIIFNRWGDIVFEQENYRNTWRGEYQKSGADLPAGTYYYTVWLDVGEGEIREGSVVIIR